MSKLNEIRNAISGLRDVDEATAVEGLISCLSSNSTVVNKASEIVTQIRTTSSVGLMEQFLAEYSLSSDEGIALMTLAEAYLRTPDAPTLDALIQDKIGTGNWKSHTSGSESTLMNMSTWALVITGRLLQEEDDGTPDLQNTLQNMVRRLGEPIVRKAIEQSMIFLGSQFVFGRSIEEALNLSKKDKFKDYAFSFDMLGEAARTMPDARKYYRAYSDAITEIGHHANRDKSLENPGISVKISALHPRYEYTQKDRVMSEVVPFLTALATQAQACNIGLTVDAEEANRLELSLDVIQAVLSNPGFKGWDGFGIAVQAYSKQAPSVIDWFYQLATSLDRRVTLRLVKGAYWDYEIKNAQILGLDSYPVFTRKEHTDASYLFCAQKLLGMQDRIYPQFATHNAHTAVNIIELAQGSGNYGFQRLHGMGEALYKILGDDYHVPCRIYAPVGVHKDLLAYLVRRLLENGANSSFVNQLLDDDVPAHDLVRDPIKLAGKSGGKSHSKIKLPSALFDGTRINSRGMDLNNPQSADKLVKSIEVYKKSKWIFEFADNASNPHDGLVKICNPADAENLVGEVCFIGAEDIGKVIARSNASFTKWQSVPVVMRSEIVENYAQQLEKHQSELIALLSREAGKTQTDGILEIREAVDFCRYYASEVRERMTGETVFPVGPIVCISPWNFPLAIFVGQIAAALVCGNTVIAKPAEQTPLIASRAVELMYEAGVPRDAVILAPGTGGEIGNALTAHPDIAGVCFTGSTQTAQIIDRNLAETGNPAAFLIAETGGQNAMIVDSTALPEQAARDIVASAFQSAGQRCSALRVLFVQQEIAPTLLEMVEGAARELRLGNPWHISTDVGPVIDKNAQDKIARHCQTLREQGRQIFGIDVPNNVKDNGFFVSPSAFRIDKLSDLPEEIFGPVLHVISYAADQLDDVIEQINSSGYGLTLGIHSRINARIDNICGAAQVGNIYVNRNQIGAVVGVQPFGGMGLSGTGPKAGGPHYLSRFVRRQQKHDKPRHEKPSSILFGDDAKPAKPGSPSSPANLPMWQMQEDCLTILLDLAHHLPEDWRPIANDTISEIRQFDQKPRLLIGPTGENNLYTLQGRGIILCLGDGSEQPDPIIRQCLSALGTGNAVMLSASIYSDFTQTLKSAGEKSNLPEGLIISAPGKLKNLLNLEKIASVAFEGAEEDLRKIRSILANRPGPRSILIQHPSEIELFTSEKLISTDTTASGGNASLLMEIG